MKPLRDVAACCCLALLAACESPSSGVDEHDLAVAARQLESMAREGAWLAQQLGAHSVNLGMAWVHQQALAQDAMGVAKDLAKPVPPRLRPTHARVMALCVQLQERVSRIAPAAADGAELASLQRELAALGDAAHPIGGER